MPHNTKKKMETINNIIEIIKDELNAEILGDTRLRKEVEGRALFCHVLREYFPKMTFTEIGSYINKSHCTVIYLLKNYSIYESSNKKLEAIKETIVLMLDNDNSPKEFRNAKIKKLEAKVKEQEEIIKTLKIDYKVIEDLNKLLTNTKGTEKHLAIKDRLRAFYDINCKAVYHN